MKFITKRMQHNLHIKYSYYREQNMRPNECHKYALRDLGLPEDFDINQYEVVNDTDERAIDNSKDFVGIRQLNKILIR